MSVSRLLESLGAESRQEFYRVNWIWQGLANMLGMFFKV